jgi:hypothetical protein
MAWNGTHPHVSRKVARTYLPPASCRRCVYAFRIAVGSKLMARRFAGSRCSRPRHQTPPALHDQPGALVERNQGWEAPLPGLYRGGMRL